MAVNQTPKDRPYEDNLAVITSAPLRAKVDALLNEIKHWTPPPVKLRAVNRNKVSMLIEQPKGPDRLFACLAPKSKHCLIYARLHRTDEDWVKYGKAFRMDADTQDSDISPVKQRMKARIQEILDGI